MQMHHQRRNAPKSDREHCPSKVHESPRRHLVEKLGVKREQATTEKAGQRQAKEEKDPLEVALTPVAQNHHDPKEWQNSARGEHNKSQIKKPAHPIGPSLSLQ